MGFVWRFENDMIKFQNIYRDNSKFLYNMNFTLKQNTGLLEILNLLRSTNVANLPPKLQQCLNLIFLYNIQERKS